MNKYFRFLVAFICTFSLSVSFGPRAHAQMGPKPRAFLTIAGYGAAGGALLGAASMAFGSDGSAIPKGASLGLYAGLLFATYILVSHHQKRYGPYDDQSSPYQDSSDIYGDDYQNDEGGSGEGADEQGGFFDRFRPIQEKFLAQSLSLGAKDKGVQIPPLSVNVLQFNF
jgi:hypothetical protein